MTRFRTLPGAAALAALGLAFAAPARAELIVFEDGRVVKAEGYQLYDHEQELEIRLPGGGSYRVDLSRVDRIVDDEVVIDAVVVEEPGRAIATFDSPYWRITPAELAARQALAADAVNCLRMKGKVVSVANSPEGVPMLAMSMPKPPGRCPRCCRISACRVGRFSGLETAA